MKISLGSGINLEISLTDITNLGALIKIFNILVDHDKRIEALEKRYPALQKGVARDPKPDEMNLQQGRKSPTRKPLAADHPASSHKKQYWTAEREDLLRDNFYKKTMDELVQILPGFSEAEIQAKAGYMGMKFMVKSGEKDGAGSH
jgi:hypothetical protein